MPYAEDYDAAAATLDAVAQATAVLLDPARATLDSGVLIGGQLSDVVTDQLAAAATGLVQIGTELGQLAATCRERAEVCRQATAGQQAYQSSYAGYQSELGHWQDAVDARAADPGAPDPGPAPVAPPAPATAAPWVNH